MVTDLKAFVAISIPSMFLFGMRHALSGVALTIAAFESYAVITNVKIVPPLTGPVLAIIIIAGSFGYGFATRKRRVVDQLISPTQHNHDEDFNSNR